MKAAVMKETDREVLERREESNRQRQDEIPDERTKLEAEYNTALDDGDRDEAKRLKLALAELDAEAEMLEDESKRLKSQWPKIRRQEANDRIPGLLSQYNAAIEAVSRNSAIAERNYLDGLRGLEAQRQAEHDCGTLLHELRALAAEAGRPLPGDLSPVPARFNREKIINTVGAIQSVCA